MKCVESNYDLKKRVAYFSDDLQQRYLLKAINDENGLKKVAVIMMNPKLQDENFTDPVVDHTVEFLKAQIKETIAEVNIVNLFPFREDHLNQLDDYFLGKNMREFESIRQNLHMIKRVVKEMDYIISAWGSLRDQFSELHYLNSIRDIHHLLRVFQKEQNCFVFSLKGVADGVNSDGQPFHPREGPLAGIRRVNMMYMENGKLILRINSI